jgi:hypothetical protein
MGRGGLDVTRVAVPREVQGAYPDRCPRSRRHRHEYVIQPHTVAYNTSPEAVTRPGTRAVRWEPALVPAGRPPSKSVLASRTVGAHIRLPDGPRLGLSLRPRRPHPPSAVRSPDLSSVLLARVPSAGDPDEHRLREEVAGRLERACAHLEPDRFADLVESIVELKLR